MADALLLDRFVAAGSPLFVSRRSVRRAAAAVADRAGFDLPLDRDFAEIGPADQQMVAIARALSREAALLILDEPTASLSAREAARLFDVLEGLRSRGLAIIYISHRTGDIARLADRAVVLRGGRIAAALPRPIDLSAALTAMIGRPIDSLAAERRECSAVVLDARDLVLAAGGPSIDLILRRRGGRPDGPARRRQEPSTRGHRRRGAGFAPLDRPDETWREVKAANPGIVEKVRIGVVNDTPSRLPIRPRRRCGHIRRSPCSLRPGTKPHGA